jgi:hypothetical protein
MERRERNGVSLGQPVRDLDGTSLGRVRRLLDWGFEARRTFIGRNYVVRYDEVRAVRDGTLVVSRSRRDLFELAAGGIPASWRVPAPPAFPTAATPAEARELREDLAAGRVRGAAADAGLDPRQAHPEGPAPTPAPGGPVTEEELRAFVDTRGQSLGPRHGGTTP